MRDRKITLKDGMSALFAKFAWQGVLRHLQRVAKSNAQGSQRHMAVAWLSVAGHLKAAEGILLKARDMKAA